MNSFMLAYACFRRDKMQMYGCFNKATVCNTGYVYLTHALIRNTIYIRNEKMIFFDTLIFLRIERKTKGYRSSKHALPAYVINSWGQKKCAAIYHVIFSNCPEWKLHFASQFELQLQNASILVQVIHNEGTAHVLYLFLFC